jgi:nucleotide-binding universal stress UspA family protein
VRGSAVRTGSAEKREVMFRTMLVPVDGTDLAERALAYAVALARPADGHMILLRAEPLVWQARRLGERASTVEADRSCQAWLSPVDPEARITLEAAAARVQADGVTAEVDFQRYLHGEMEPADAILAVARERQADLVVVSTHSRSGVARWFHGGVADQLVRGAHIPVMVVPAAVDHPWPEDRAPQILVPLDGSALAETVLSPVGRLAEQLGAEVVLVRVVDRDPLGVQAAAPYTAGSPLGAGLADVWGYLADILDRIRWVGISVTARAVIGNPSTTIAAVAREEDVDLIVMATHGCGGLGRVVLGRVADATLQGTAVPALLVRPSAARRTRARLAIEAAPAPAMSARRQA